MNKEISEGAEVVLTVRMKRLDSKRLYFDVLKVDLDEQEEKSLKIFIENSILKNNLSLVGIEDFLK